MKNKYIILLIISLSALNTWSQELDTEETLSRSKSFFSHDKIDLLSVYYNVFGRIGYTAEIYGGMRDKADIEHFTASNQPGLQFRRLQKVEPKLYRGFTFGYHNVLFKDSIMNLSSQSYQFFDGGNRHEIFGGISTVTIEDRYYTSLDLTISLYSALNSQSPALQSSIIGFNSKIQWGYFLNSNLSIDAFGNIGIMILKNFEVNNLRYEVATGTSTMFGIGLTYKIHTD